MPRRACALPIDYDIVHVHAPRYGNDQNTIWPDTARPLTPDPGATLMLLHADRSEELLFPRPEHADLVDAPIGNGSVADPNVSFDGLRVVFTYHHDRTDVNSQRGSGDASLSYDGSDTYVVDLTTRVVQRLTHQEFTPNTGNGADFDCSRSGTNCPQVGVFDSGPAWLSAGGVPGPESAVVQELERGGGGDGERIRIDGVSQSGTTITVTGAGFSPRTVISFFNAQPGGVVNLGGLVNGTPSLIPLTISSSARFTFEIPVGASGPSYVQALNPPFMPFSASGNDAGGAFTLVVQ